MKNKKLKSIQSYLSRYLDGELSSEESRLVEAKSQTDPEIQKFIESQRIIDQEIKNTILEIEPMNSIAHRLQQFISILPQTLSSQSKRTWSPNWGFHSSKLKYAGLAAVFLLLTLLIVPSLILPHLQSLDRGTGTSTELSVMTSWGPDTGNAMESETRSRGESRRGGVAGGSFRGRDAAVPTQERFADLGRAFATDDNEIDANAPTQERFSDSLSLGDTPVLGRPMKQIEELSSLGYTAGTPIMDMSTAKGTSGGFGAMGGGMGMMGMGGEGSPAPQENAPSLGYGLNDTDSDGVTDTAPSTEPVVEPDKRKVIRHADLLMEVKVLSEAQSAVERIVSEAQGLSAQVILREKEKPPWAQYTLWIPSEKLDSVIESLKPLGEVNHMEMAIQDITESYFDQETRIRNLQRQEERLLKLYERDTVKMEELLRVEQEIARVRTEIEQMQGRQRMWDRQIQYSTLTLNLRQKPELQPIVKSEATDVFSPLRRAGKDALAVVLYSCSLLTTLIAWIFSSAIFVVPWVVILGGLWYGGKRWMK